MRRERSGRRMLEGKAEARKSRKEEKMRLRRSSELEDRKQGHLAEER